MDTTAEKKTAVGEESQMIQDIKGKIVELSWKLKKTDTKTPP